MKAKPDNCYTIRLANSDTSDLRKQHSAAMEVYLVDWETKAEIELCQYEIVMWPLLFVITEKGSECVITIGDCASGEYCPIEFEVGIHRFALSGANIGHVRP